MRKGYINSLKKSFQLIYIHLINRNKPLKGRGETLIHVYGHVCARSPVSSATVQLLLLEDFLQEKNPSYTQSPKEQEHWSYLPRSIPLSTLFIYPSFD